MKKTTLLLISLSIFIILQAQVSKTLDLPDRELSVPENDVTLYLIIGSTRMWDSISHYYTSVESNTSWSVNVDQDWVTYDKSSGTGNDYVMFKYYNNPTSSVRTAIATFSGVGVTSQTITLTQEPTPVFFTVSDDTISIGSAASNSEYVTVTTDMEERPWIASSNQTWLTVSSAIFFGDSTLYFDAEENSTSSNRFAIVTV
jgi:hypothetical protein